MLFFLDCECYSICNYASFEKWKVWTFPSCKCLCCPLQCPIIYQIWSDFSLTFQSHHHFQSSCPQCFYGAIDQYCLPSQTTLICIVWTCHFQISVLSYCFDFFVFRLCTCAFIGFECLHFFLKWKPWTKVETFCFAAVILSQSCGSCEVECHFAACEWSTDAVMLLLLYISDSFSPKLISRKSFWLVLINYYQVLHIWFFSIFQSKHLDRQL